MTEHYGTLVPLLKSAKKEADNKVEARPDIAERQHKQTLLYEAIRKVKETTDKLTEWGDN